MVNVVSVAVTTGILAFFMGYYRGSYEELLYDTVIDYQTNIDCMSLKIGGNTVINNTRNITASSFISVASGTRIDSSGDINAASKYSVNGTQVVGARQSAIANPSGGSTVDTEGRAATASILAALRSHGLIAT